MKTFSQKEKLNSIKPSITKQTDTLVSPKPAHTETGLGKAGMEKRTQTDDHPPSEKTHKLRSRFENFGAPGEGPHIGKRNHREGSCLRIQHRHRQDLYGKILFRSSRTTGLVGAKMRKQIREIQVASK